MTESSYAATIHAPTIAPKIRHSHIMDIFDKLNSGETMLLSNDHNPKPLYYQFMFERENQFNWKYLEEGPELWRVAIGKK